jgi:catechol 2,3-dioxygenase-like lactoylglutathione lyase family enzyme
VTSGGLHHVELWVPDLARARAEWGWLLGRLGYEPFQDWDDGCSWRLGETYLVVEQSPALTVGQYDRLRPGLNHLAFHAGARGRRRAGLRGPGTRLDATVPRPAPVRGRPGSLRRLSR